jgi:dimethylargininase
VSDKPRYDIVRPPGDSFVRAVSNHPDRDKIDPARARRQHEDYRFLLENMVGEILELRPDERYPDSCFTQDTAVVVDGHALIARTGIPTRRGETTSIAKALKPLVESVTELPPPGTLEGGDVVRLGKRLLVGQSRRTTSSAIDYFHDWAKPLGFRVVPVRVPMGILHLSTAVTVLNDELVMGHPQVLEDEVFDSVATLPIHDDPLQAYNALVIGQRVIASGEYKVHDLLEKEGFIVHHPDLTEFVRADAGPTCLSLLID